MVSIAARCEGRHERDDLRHVALWYPRIPEPSLNLNTDTFIPKQNVASMYEPLCWTMFGGPGGSHLNALTGMSVFRAKCTIEFHYNNDDIPAECRTAGCWPHDEYDIGVHFDIDGPGGEVIDSLTVLNYEHDDTDDNIVWFFKPGYMESLEVCFPRATHHSDHTNVLPDFY